MNQTEWRERVLSHFPEHSKAGNGFKARCPAHDDKNPSLTIYFKQTEDGEKAQIQCRSGCEWSRILQSAQIDKKELFYHQNGNGNRPHLKTTEPPKKQEKAFIRLDFDHPTTIYSYTDENGAEIYQNCRYETDKLGNRLDKKTFRQRHKIGDEWAYALNGLRRVPYNLPALIREPYMVIDCEGEKDADTLNAMGLTATSTLKECFDELHNFCLSKVIVICEDNDEPGRKKAQEKAKKYWDVGAEVVKILTFKDMPEGADVSDWIASNPVENDIFALQIKIDDTPPYNPLHDIIIDFTREVVPRKPLITIDGRNALPSGNVGGIVAGINQGKSHFAEIIASSAIKPGCEPLSYLEVSLEESEKVCIMDTEQPGDDCQEILYRAFRRVGQKPHFLKPDKSGFKQFEVMSMIDLSLTERREKLSMVLKRPEYKLNIIDGLLDFVANPNDPEECATFIIWLHSMAAKYNKGVFCILHGNRNDISGKGKGWLGDIFQRKATVFLMLRKHKLDPSVRVLTTEFDNAKFRKADDSGLNIAMQWNEEIRGFSCVPYTAEDADRLTPRDIFTRCFSVSKKVRMKKKELVRAYCDITGKASSSAYREIEKAIGLYLKKEKLFYSLDIEG